MLWVRISQGRYSAANHPPVPGGGRPSSATRPQWGPGRAYRVVPTRANGQPALGVYLADPHASACRAYCLLVITTAGDHITAITSFSTNVMTRFGLPRTLPETD